jgi:hypothetical protein
MQGSRAAWTHMIREDDHSRLRSALAERPPGPSEMEEMEDILCDAVDGGAMECARVLVEYGARFSDAVDVLCHALDHDNANGVRIVLWSGCHRIRRHPDRAEVMTVAMQEGNAECIRLLIDAGLSVWDQDPVPEKLSSRNKWAQAYETAVGAARRRVRAVLIFGTQRPAAGGDPVLAKELLPMLAEMVWSHRESIRPSAAPAAPAAPAAQAVGQKVLSHSGGQKAGQKVLSHSDGRKAGQRSRKRIKPE